MISIIICFLIFLISLSLDIIRRSKSRRDHRLERPKLPPGSMGWPFIGETLQLYSQDPNVFFINKQRRYGEIFKTHIHGSPCVMLASPEAALFVLETQAHSFKPTYPKSKERLIGPSALLFHQGDYHMRLRELVQGSLSLFALPNLVSDISSTALSTVDSFRDRRVVDTLQGMKKFSFDVGILAIFGKLERRYREELEKNFTIVDKGYNSSLRTSIPGTPYKKALKAKKRLNKILIEIIKERKEKKVEEKDLLGDLLKSKDKKGEELKDEEIADNIIGVLFGAQDSTANALTSIVKYLHDNPNLLEAVKAEQIEIYEMNKRCNQSLSWDQTRNMPYTHKVVLESLRMASTVPFILREAVADVEYKGYLIPKGWKVMPLLSNIHHNPKFFSDPRQFDPSKI